MMLIKNNFNCINYLNKQEVYFSQPKSWVLWALINLHNYLAFFLINVFVIVVVFTFFLLIKQQKIKNKKTNFAFFKNYTSYKLGFFGHAPWIEFFRTIIPLIMLFFMGWPSFKLLYAIEQLIDPLHTIIVLGNQWYRTYEYSDFDVVSNIIMQLDQEKEFRQLKKKVLLSMHICNTVVTNEEILNRFDNKQFFQSLGKTFRSYEESKLMYDCVLISDEDLPLGYPRMLSTDQILILPATIGVRLLITSNDVIHSWALPSHGIKMDAVPGRINQVNFITHAWGTYWGQCSELCGINHGFMPIEVRVLCINDYLDYIRMLMSYKYDKFLPLVNILLKRYFNSIFVLILNDRFGEIFKKN